MMYVIFLVVFFKWTHACVYVHVCTVRKHNCFSVPVYIIILLALQL